MKENQNLEDGCLLVLVLDIHPSLALEAGTVETYLSSITSFANLHLAYSGNNRLAVIAANHAETNFIYPKSSEKEVKIPRQVDGRLELVSHVDKSIHDGLKKMVLSTNVFTQIESLIAGALGRALLYIRHQESLDTLGKKINARILTIKTSPDSGGQYLNFINMYLTAQKMRVTLDMCVLANDCGLLQQGADITGGYYHKVNTVSELLQTMLMSFSGDVEVRHRLASSGANSGGVDYRASCFCHGTLVDTAAVCSNCLSVYCKAVPLCPTCNAVFRVDMPLRKPIKKKR